MMTAGQFATARRGGLTGYETEFVRQKTAAGVPLSAVSKMLGRNIESLRDHAAEVFPRGVVAIKPPPPKVDRDAQEGDGGEDVIPEDFIGEPLRLARAVMGPVSASFILEANRSPDAHLRDLRDGVVWRLHAAGFTATAIGRWLGVEYATVAKVLQAYAERHEVSLHRHIEPWKPGEPLDQLADRVAGAYGLTRARFRSKTRARAVVVARQHFMFLAREAGLWSWTLITRACGLEDHTTALHGVRQHAARHGLDVPA